MLEGTLDDFDLRFIFRFLSFTRKTGKLTVAGPAAAGRIFFRAGEVYHAESDVRREGFGRKLVNAGRLTEDELRQTLEYCAAQGRGLGEGLVARGVVARRDLELVLREEIEDVALSLFGNQSGRFSFAPGERVDSDTLILVRVESLLDEDSEDYKAKVPVLNPPAVTGDAAMRQITISAEEWALIASIDGRRTLGEIGERLGMSEFVVLRSLRRLLAAGLVVLPGESRARSAHRDRPVPALPLRGASAQPPPPPRARRAPPPPPPPPPPPTVEARERG